MRIGLGPSLAGVLALVGPSALAAEVQPGTLAEGSAPSSDGELGSSDEAPREGATGSPAADAVRLHWEAPASCGDEAAVRRGLAGYLRGETAVEAGEVVEVEARVIEDGDGFRLQLRTETPSGVTTRVTTAQECSVLVDATALIVAIAVDPTAVMGRSDEVPLPPEPEPSPEPPPPEEPQSTEPPPEESPPEEPGPITPVRSGSADAEPGPPLPVRFGMRAAGGVDVGVLPGPAGGLRLAGAVLGGPWRAELRGDVWLPRTALAQAELGARVSVWSVGARGCGVPTVAGGAIELPLCGGVEAGAMRGDPVGDRVAGGETVRRPWLAADASAGLAWVPRRFLGLVVQAELVVPILRAGFRVGEVEVHRAGPVAGRALLGLEARFP